MAEVETRMNREAEANSIFVILRRLLGKVGIILPGG